MASDNQGTAERGRRLVGEVARERGAEVTELMRGNMVLLELRKPGSSRRVHVRVKTRTGGTWQGSIRDADPDPLPSSPEAFWVFVDLENPRTPEFYVVPDGWMRRDIHRAHQEYLERHGGRRALAQDSLHHAIEPRRVRQWKDRWDLLDL